MSRVDEVLERISCANNALVSGQDMTNVLLSQISVSLAYIVDALNADRNPISCETCKHKNDGWYSEVCTSCSITYSNYEPQTERSE